jgi:flagellar basal-body rod modification protein FlgD
MSSVSQAGGVPLAPDPDPYPTVGKKDLDRNDFMKLFVTQLKYQDPTKPMDTYEMSNQLATFSSMDATLKMKDSMDQLLAFQTSQNNLSLLGLLDREVKGWGDAITVDGGKVTPAVFGLDAPCETCVVEIKDAGGHTVRRMDLGALGQGEHDVDWDGRNDAGDTVPDAAYTYEVRALDARGQSVGVETYSVGKVTGIAFADGSTVLTVDHQASIGADKVLRVR